MEGLSGRAFQARDWWGHIGATSGPRTTGSQRTTAVTSGTTSCQLTRPFGQTAQVAVRAGRSLTQKRPNDWRAHDPEVLPQDAAQDFGYGTIPGMCGPGVTAARQPVQARA
jgi:hypothetical protein